MVCPSSFMRLHCKHAEGRGDGGLLLVLAESGHIQKPSYCSFPELGYACHIWTHRLRHQSEYGTHIKTIPLSPQLNKSLDYKFHMLGVKMLSTCSDLKGRSGPIVKIAWVAKWCLGSSPLTHLKGAAERHSEHGGKESPGTHWYIFIHM